MFASCYLLFKQKIFSIQIKIVAASSSTPPHPLRPTKTNLCYFKPLLSFTDKINKEIIWIATTQSLLETVFLKNYLFVCFEFMSSLQAN